MLPPTNPRASLWGQCVHITGSYCGAYCIRRPLSNTANHAIIIPKQKLYWRTVSVTPRRSRTG